MTHAQINRDQKEAMIEEIRDLFIDNQDNRLVFHDPLLIFVLNENISDHGLYPHIINSIDEFGNIECSYLNDSNEKTVAILHDLSIDELGVVMDEIDNKNYFFKT